MSEDEFLDDFFDDEDPDSSGERNWWDYGDEDYQMMIDYPDELWIPGTTMGKAEIDRIRTPCDQLWLIHG